MRPSCGGCDRPLSVCLCAVLPSPPLPLCRTHLLVLQHPHESKHKLATVPLLVRCLENCHLVVARRLHSASWPSSIPMTSPAADDDEVHHALLLFPGPHAVELGSWCSALTCKDKDAGMSSLEQVSMDGRERDKLASSAAEQDANSCKANHLDLDSLVGYEHHMNKAQATKLQITLVVIDGTWEHAQEMVKASLPFLNKFVVQVCLPFDRHSEGHGMGDSDLILRKEPFGGCVSTMEAVAHALSVLEPDGHVIEGKLMAVLRKMVSLQASHTGIPKIRSKMKKKSKQTDTRQSLEAG